MIGIVNYGLGNVHAIANIYKRLNIEVCIASTSDELKKADRIILPGVGAFDWAMTRLKISGMRDTLDNLVINRSRPVLGICVGMQIMDESIMGLLKEGTISAKEAYLSASNKKPFKPFLEQDRQKAVNA